MTDTAIFSAGRRIHFVGIGGAGMSALAKVAVERGARVTGSDLKTSRPITALEAMGANIGIGHDAGLVGDADYVVASSAIPTSNPEIVAARSAGIPVVGRGEALAELTNSARGIAVAGTHGKTTTTSMIVSILSSSGLDPTYLVGGGLNDAGTNARSGTDDLVVCESDESDGSFLLLRPRVAVVTNIELDHVDYWASMDALREAFARFVAAVPADGSIVVPSQGVELDVGTLAPGRRVITFGEGGDVDAVGVRSGERGSEFTLVAGGASSPVSLAVPGTHNVENALAAAGAALSVGVSVEAAAAGLSSYRGVERRFELRGEARGVTVIDDYAHHPSEVRATLQAARSGSWRRIVAVFQPHRYSRTAALADSFGPAFAGADRVVVTDVYGAGEPAVPGVTGKLVADSVCAALPGRAVAYLPHRAEVAAYLEGVCRPGDALLTLGAGDITTLADELLLAWQ